MKTTILVAAITAGFMVTTAEAHDRRGADIDLPTFEEFDANADGAVTMDEVQTVVDAMQAARFEDADTNGDGGLSADEMLARFDTERQGRAESRINDRIESADTNGDGLLQQDEIAAAAEGRDRRGPGLERMFNRVDADENGSISAEEYAEARAKFEERGQRGN